MTATIHEPARQIDVIRETDVLVAVPHDRPARVIEMQLLVLHCLCDAVDSQLLGDQEINP